MNLEEYLVTKRIDGEAFQQHEPERWQEWKNLLEQMSPTSFTAQKLYLINPIRRKYPLKHTPETPVAPATVPKPVMRPKPKIN